MGMKVRLPNGSVDEFEDRYGDTATTEHENLFHDAEVDPDARLTVFEIYERWVYAPQDTSRPRKAGDQRERRLEDQRKRAVAVYQPDQWASYRVTQTQSKQRARRGRGRARG